MHPDNLSWPKHTERLSLRPIRPDDLDAMFEYRSRPDVARWLPSRPTDLTEYRTSFEKYRHVTLVVEWAGVVVADLYLAVGDLWAQQEIAAEAKGKAAEVGWVVSPDHQGRGIAREAATELVRICFQDLGVHRISGICFTDNLASAQLMDRLGMRREAHFRGDSLHAELGWQDSYVYALLAEDWASSRKV